jgi:vibriolysin
LTVFVFDEQQPGGITVFERRQPLKRRLATFGLGCILAAHSIFAFAQSEQATGPGGNVKSGKVNWGSGPGFPRIPTVKNGENCALDSANVIVSDWGNKLEVDGDVRPFSFRCFNNDQKSINGAYSALNDAMVFGDALFKMYESWIGVPPITNKLSMRVHYGENLENAFWNGVAMFFGDGGPVMYPLVAIDTLAHEVSHGFTQQHSGLVYENQSGGMNESFSDMAGEALEFFFVQTYGPFLRRPMPDYKVGFEIMKEADKGLRDMCNPGQDGGSIDNVVLYREGMDPHYSSGVYNKVFCVLAKSTNWDPKTAFQVFALANKNYWTANSTFQTGAEGTVAAAAALGFSVQDVVAAFRTVGLTVQVPNVPTTSAPSAATANRLNSSLSSELKGRWFIAQENSSLLIEGDEWTHPSKGRASIRWLGANEFVVNYPQQAGVKCSYRVSLRDSGSTLSLNPLNALQPDNYCPAGDLILERQR